LAFLKVDIASDQMQYVVLDYASRMKEAGQAKWSRFVRADMVTVSERGKTKATVDFGSMRETSR
jgi:hypothetical protein